MQGTSKLLSYEIERNPNNLKEKVESQYIKKPSRKRSKSNNKKLSIIKYILAVPFSRMKIIAIKIILFILLNVDL